MEEHGAFPLLGNGTSAQRVERPAWQFGGAGRYPGLRAYNERAMRPLPAAQPPKGAPEILVVDDDAALRELMTEVLSGCGYEVATTGRGSDGIRIARKEIPDLILLDARLPDLEGAEVLRQLREDPATAAIPVMMYTAYPRASAEWTAAEALGVPLLSKPFDVNDLLERVRSQLGGT